MSAAPTTITPGMNAHADAAFPTVLEVRTSRRTSPFARAW